MTPEEELAFQQAIEEVGFWSEACLPPSLDTNELETIVKANQAARIWQPNTAYAVGDTVTADPPNGVVYTCTTAGTSGAIQPAWPSMADSQCGCCGASITDGTSGWSATGTFTNLFDINQAVYQAWLKKAGKATVLVQTSSAGQSWASQQVFTHISLMCARWQPVEVA
jgi:hypothetical protein